MTIKVIEKIGYVVRYKGAKDADKSFVSKDILHGYKSRTTDTVEIEKAWIADTFLAAQTFIGCGKGRASTDHYEIFAYSYTISLRLCDGYE